MSTPWPTHTDAEEAILQRAQLDKAVSIYEEALHETGSLHAAMDAVAKAVPNEDPLYVSWWWCNGRHMEKEGAIPSEDSLGR